MQSFELHKTYTPEEYFLLEEPAEVRHKFINGNLIEISGASREHRFICQNIFLALLYSANLLVLRSLLRI